MISASFVLTLIFAVAFSKPAPKVPLLCTSQHRIAVEEISHDYNCSMFLDENPGLVYRQTFALWRKNIFNHKYDAIVCAKTVKREHRMPYFWGNHGTDEHHEEEWFETIPPSECKAMNQSGRHSVLGTLFNNLDGSSSTLNLFKSMETGHQAWDAGKWVFADTVNAFIQSTKMMVDSSGRMSSPAGSMLICDSYPSGYCVLPNNLTILWKPNLEERGKYLFWRKQEFNVLNQIIVSTDRSKAFSSGSEIGEGKLLNDEGTFETVKVYRAPQGILYTPLGEPKLEAVKDVNRITDPTTKQRMLKYLETDTELEVINRGRSGRRKREERGDIAGTADASAAIQAALHFHLEEESKTLKIIAFQMCRTSEITSRFLVSGASTEIGATMFARELTGASNVIGEMSGNHLSIYACQPVNTYKFLPMNETCSKNIPLTYTADKIEGKGYMEPTTRRITQQARKTDCSMTTEILVELEDGHYILNGKTAKLNEVSARQVHIYPKTTLDGTVVRENIVPEMSGYQLSQLMVTLSAEDYSEYNNALGRTLKKLNTMYHGGNGFEAKNPTEIAGDFFKGGLWSAIFGRFSFINIWVYGCCVLVTFVFLKEFVLPKLIQTRFEYANGSSIFNLGEGALRLRKRYKKYDEENQTQKIRENIGRVAGVNPEPLLSNEDAMELRRMHRYEVPRELLK